MPKKSDYLVIINWYYEALEYLFSCPRANVCVLFFALN